MGGAKTWFKRELKDGNLRENTDNYFEELGNKWNKRHDVVARGQERFFSIFIIRKFKTFLNN